MNPVDGLTPTPWDASALGMETFEVQRPGDEDLLRAAAARPGHYTAKVDPLSSKELLHRYGFYYCDTLLQPYCPRERFHGDADPRASVVPISRPEEVVAIGHGAFAHGRFHRDFHIAPAAADRRYDQWLTQLHREGKTFGLAWEGSLAAFFAFTEGPGTAHLALHAVGQEFRGRGLGKHLWTAGCEELFSRGHAELTSSVSATNLAILNLYASLGFRFRKPMDLYHRHNPPSPA